MSEKYINKQNNPNKLIPLRKNKIIKRSFPKHFHKTSLLCSFS